MEQRCRYIQSLLQRKYLKKLNNECWVSLAPNQSSWIWAKVHFSCRMICSACHTSRKALSTDMTFKFTGWVNCQFTVKTRATIWSKFGKVSESSHKQKMNLSSNWSFLPAKMNRGQAILNTTWTQSSTLGISLSKLISSKLDLKWFPSLLDF